MKKIAVLLLLSMVVTANAGLVIMVKTPDSPFWGEYADSKFTINPSDWILIGVMDLTGGTLPGSLLALGLASGPASLDASGIVMNQGVTAVLTDNAIEAGALGLQNPFISMEIPGTTSMGMLIRNINFHCDGPGDVTLALVDENGEIVDTQVIHQQIPEPATMMLLGLGGLAILRKRSA